MSKEYFISPIGEVLSPFKEKFGIPRQAGIISTVESKIRLFEDYSGEEFLRGLDQFSHIWILFSFHKNIDRGWKKLVRPPRLGGNKKVGVFASRAPFRPNFIGMSAVELKDIIIGKNSVLVVRGGDFVDKTPVFDIKPYVNYADAIMDASSGEFGVKPDKVFSVEFSSSAQLICEQDKGLGKRLEDILSYDTRPGYFKESSRNRIFGIKFECYDIRFRIYEDILYIEEIV